MMWMIPPPPTIPSVPRPVCATCKNPKMYCLDVARVVIAQMQTAPQMLSVHFVIY